MLSDSYVHENQLLVQPLFETQRLRVIPLTNRDTHFVMPILQSPTQMRHIGNGAMEENEAYQQFEAWLQESQQGSYHCAVCLKKTGRRIGLARLYRRLDRSPNYQLGYQILSQWQGQGFATESAQGMLRYGFGALKLARIEAYARPSNGASRRILKKIGMKEETTAFIYQGRRYCRYAIETETALVA